MFRRNPMRRGVAITLTGVVVTALAITASPASASPSPSPKAGDDVSVSAAKPVAADPAVIEAMQRDLGLTKSQAKERLAREHRAALVEQDLRERLGGSFAGAWLDKTAETFTVATTDKAERSVIKDAGAAAKVVKRSEKRLRSVKGALDRRAAPKQVVGWYVDVRTNKVVVQAQATKAGRDFADKSGDANAVRVEVVKERPQTFYDVRGGDAYYPGSSRCSIGFPVTVGFVTAGHCGGVGTSTSGYNQVAQGTVRGSIFPGSDMGYVAVNSNWTPRPWVNNYQGGNVTVAGHTEAPVGASVCRSGSTTGPRLGLVCGSIQAKNQRVCYAQGCVDGMTRTNVCAEPGDSGGSWISNGQAQGVTSGGSGNCSSGGTTYFFPINPILSQWGLTLVTEDGDPDPPTECEELGSQEGGSLSSNQTATHPGGRWYQSSGSATHRGCLDGPNGTDYDLYLQKWNGSAWSTVARSISSGPDEETTYNGTAGYYRYLVHAYAGSGTYTLTFNQP